MIDVFDTDPVNEKWDKIKADFEAKGGLWDWTLHSLQRNLNIASP